ncbi:MAG TPA: RES family NAD+ phosphorylase [Thermoanaerobaculia bacterium]|nr:RES family NAD+ phosphorylase [Thermoanaerobaculia bacterium]
MSISLPDPPEPSAIRPLLHTWKVGQSLIRCHNIRFGATEFNPGVGPSGRFHPFADREDRMVPTLYGAEDLDGALSETVFHNVPVRGPAKRIAKYVLQPMVASSLVCDRPLTLVQLYGFGLPRLEVSRPELIETDVDDYPRTAAWARALHASAPGIDGLIWVSRQNDASFALVLFGDRVARASLEVVEAPRPLGFGPGFDEVQRAAEQAGITIFE